MAPRDIGDVDGPPTDTASGSMEGGVVNVLVCGRFSLEHVPVGEYVKMMAEQRDVSIGPDVPRVRGCVGREVVIGVPADESWTVNRKLGMKCDGRREGHA